LALIQEIHDNVLVVSIDRFEKRNAVDRETAAELYQAFEQFDADEALKVAVLTGNGGTFCAGADLTAFAAGNGNRIEFTGSAPMGPTRMRLNKPVIAAIEGHAVAGGLELAIWCDLRVAAEDATLGVYCRRVGVPLIDMGTIRLPRLIGQSRALDLILTGRGVSANEALTMGLVNRVTAPGKALECAIELAKQIAAFPEIAMRHDRLSVYEQWGLEESGAMANELRHGLHSLESGESKSGAEAFRQRRRDLQSPPTPPTPKE
jgi:enoyl-CoA hydratase